MCNVLCGKEEENISVVVIDILVHWLSVATLVVHLHKLSYIYTIHVLCSFTDARGRQ